jgi:hypothetical protein
MLALNDPALAAALGAIPGTDFGEDFGDDGVDPNFGFGGFGFGAEAMGAIAQAQPSQQQMQAAWKTLMCKKAKAAQRMQKIDPNAGSDVSIERYSFSLSADFTLGTAAAFPNTMSGSPDTTFRPQMVTANAPAPGFGYLANLKMANVDVTIGPGEEDLFGLAGPSWGRTLDMPTLSTSNRARAQGRITTFTPPGYTPGDPYTLSLNFKGPANVTGGIRSNL